MSNFIREERLWLHGNKPCGRFVDSVRQDTQKHATHHKQTQFGVNVKEPPDHSTEDQCAEEWPHEPVRQDINRPYSPARECDIEHACIKLPSIFSVKIRTPANGTESQNHQNIKEPVYHSVTQEHARL